MRAGAGRGEGSARVDACSAGAHPRPCPFSHNPTPTLTDPLLCTNFYPNLQLLSCIQILRSYLYLHSNIFRWMFLPSTLLLAQEELNMLKGDGGGGGMYGGDGMYGDGYGATMDADPQGGLDMDEVDGTAEESMGEGKESFNLGGQSDLIIPSYASLVGGTNSPHATPHHTTTPPTTPGGTPHSERDLMSPVGTATTSVFDKPPPLQVSSNARLVPC